MLNPKQRFSLNRIIISSGQLQFKFDSSSKVLEQNLLARGIKLPFKLYVPYRLPGNLSPQEYEKYIQKHIFFAFCQDKQYMDVFLITNLSDADNKAIRNYIVRNSKKSYRIINRNVKRIKKLNPILKNIHLSCLFDKVDFIQGVNYGFAPQEIKYFISLNKLSLKTRERVINKQTKLAKQKNLSISYILQPNRLKAILKRL